MPYEIRKLKRGHYEVLNSETGQVHAKQTSLAKAKAQVRLLGMKHAEGGHRGVAHPKTKKQIHDYYQQWYKKNRKSVLRRMEKRRLAGGLTPNPPPVLVDGPPFPNHAQLVGIYEEIRDLFNNQQFDQANAELDAFIEEFDLTDETRAMWHQEDPHAENAFGDIFQLVAGGEELYNAGYRAPADINALDSGEMDELIEGSESDSDEEEMSVSDNEGPKRPREGDDEEGPSDKKLKGGANGDSDEGETDSEWDTDDEEDNPLAHPHYWDGHQWVPVVPNPPPANLFEDDEILEGNGYYRMSNGCALYTGGSHVMPINYSGELKSNSWYPMGYSGGGRVMPVNHSAELKSSFGTF